MGLDDKLAITESGEAILCTRGAHNAKLLSEIPGTLRKFSCGHGMTLQARNG